MPDATRSQNSRRTPNGDDAAGGVGGAVVIVGRALLSHRCKRSVQAVEDGPEGRHRRGRLGHALRYGVTPFPRPDTGKIAVKVIDDYGDEVMKVFEV